MADYFTNFGTSQVAVTALTTTSTTLTLPAGDGNAKFPSQTPFMVLLGDPTATYELSKCTARSGDVLTLVRGNNLPAPDTTASNNWGLGTTVSQVVTAGNLTHIWSSMPPIFNVAAYGAVGNGTTDDAPAINSALQAAAAAGSGVVVLGNATYATGSALVIPGDNIILAGSGWGTVIKPISGANFDVIATAVPSSAGLSGYVRNYIGVRDLMIDCSNMSGATAGQGNGVHFYGVRYSTIDRVYVLKCPNWAILLDGDNTGPGNNFGYDNLVWRCVFDQCNAGCYQTNCEANDFVENRFKWAGTACAALQPANGSQDTTAMHLRCGSGYAYISGNIFGKGGTYTTEAIRLSNSGPCRVIGNRFDQVRYQAIVMNAGNHEFAFNALGSPGSVATGVPAIQIGNSNNRVIGNSFDTTAGGTSFSYAVAEAGGPFSNNIIADNNLLKGTSGLINLNAASNDKVHHNGNYNPLSPLAPPAAPAPTTATTGGTVAAGTYGIEVTLVNAWGETVASVNGPITTTGATSTITIPSPARAGNATGWYAYVTQAGGSTYTRQQTAGSPTTLGTSLVLTAPPTSTGANPPGANTTAGFTTPSVPASGVAQTNLIGTDMTVMVSGGTVTAIAVAGVTTGLTSGVFRLPAGSSITLTYSAAPTWVWLGD